jgi:hypothetical protein
MSENRFYAVPVIVALLVLGSLTAWQVATSAEVISEAAHESRVRSPGQDSAPLEECFDVSLSELAGCRMASQNTSGMGQKPGDGRPLPPDECFDVPVGEVCDK